MGAHDNTIGGSVAGARNVIAASGANGIQIEGTGTDNNVVQGNFIGTDATGELDRGNTSDGVRIGNGAQSNTIGGTAPEARNIISGNDGDGVDIQGNGTTGNVVQGNYIGTDDDGEQDLGNSAEGVDLSADGNTIGGSVAGAGNVISGNNLRGIYVTGAGVSATIQGNYVGLDDDGLQALGNNFDGIEVAFGAGGVTIQDNVVAANGQWGITLQGTGAGNTLIGNTVGLNRSRTIILGGAGVYVSTDGNTLTGNTIGGSNSYGIYLTGSSDNTIQGNYIGTNSAGSTGIGNAWQGIGIDGANSDFNLIGGTDSGEGNVIAHNARDGISIASGAGTGISILGNTFRSNGGLAIDLSDNGVTANDSSGNPADQDIGPNGLQNFPEFSSVRLSGTDLIIEGDLRTDGVSTPYRLEFYGNPIGTADATNGEGRIYLGSTLVTTDADGRVSFSVTLFAAGLTTGDSVTGTATRVDALAQVGVSDQLAYGSTSEFATNMTVAASNSAPTLVASAALNSIQEDPTSNTGTLVSLLVDTEATDPDVGAVKGIAITAAPTTNGSWEYTLNGTTWLSMGTPSTAAALLLSADATTAIRFVPNTNFNGVSGLLSYKAWDQTSGTAGGTADVTISGASSAFSLQTNGTSVSVSAVNDQPTFTSLDGAPTHIEGGSSVFLDTNVSILDVELSALNDFDGATLTLNRQGGANPEDQLAFDGLTVTVSGTDLFVSGTQVGTYLFTGGGMSIAFGAGATNAQVNTVLQNIVYWNSSDNPPTSVQLEWVFSDGNSGAQGSGGALQITGTSTVNITPANDAPSITLMNVGGPYVEGGTPALFDTAPVLSDPDSTNFDTGTLTASIVSAGTADDRITIRHQGTAAGQIGVSGNDVTYGGTVIGTWAGGTDGFTPLVVTFNSQATVAAVQALSGNIQFSNVSENPSTTSRLVRIVLTDGDGGTSNNGQNLLAVTAVNDATVVTTTGTSLTYTENQSATAVDSALTISDVDNTNLTGATVSISGNYANGQDVLAFTNQLGISGSWNAAAGVLTLTGTTTVTNYQTALRSITYVNSSDAPSTLARTVSFIVNDGTANSTAATRGISITSVNDAPTIGSGSLAAVLEDTLNPAGATISSLVGSSFADPDAGASLSGIVVTSNNAPLSEGVWQYSTDSGTSWFDVGTVGVNGLALNVSTRVRFVPAADFSGSPTIISFRGLDNTYAGGFTSGATRVTVDTSSPGGTSAISSSLASINTTVTAVNDVPVRTAGSVSNLTVLEDSGLTSLGLSGVTYSPGGGVDENSQTLTYTVTAIPALSVGRVYLADGTTAVTVGSYTLTEIRGMQFQPTHNASGVSAFQFNVTDSGDTSNGGQNSFSEFILLTVSAVNDAPVLATSTGTLAYSENDPPTPVDPSLTVSDVDNVNLTGATITISSNFVFGEDVLAFTNQFGITGSWNAATGVLTLTGTTSVANYQAALRTVTYANTSGTPSTSLRTIQFQVSDGATSSSPAFREVSVAAVNNAPTISSISNQTIDEDTVLGPLAFTVNDIDSSNLVVTAATSDGSLIPLGNIVLGGTGTNQTVTVTPAPNLYGGPVTITLTVSDGSLIAQTSFDVIVQPINDPPTIINSTFSVSEIASNGTLVGTVVAGDVDLGDTRSFSVLSGDPLGAFTIDATGQITVADASQLDFETRPTWTLTV